MNTGLHASLPIRLCLAATTAALLLAPVASRAQNYNTATGPYALFYNTTGSYNTADGYSALVNNNSGSNNTGSGAQALYWNNSGNRNTGSGFQALYFNSSGSYNTASGAQSLFSNGNGSANTADGYYALFSNTTGGYNTASGFYALFANGSGYYNTANGDFALYQSTGNYNIALGYSAGYNITNGNNNITIGNFGASSDNGVIRIGTPGTQKATYVAGISGVAASGGVAVYVNSNGQLGTLTSSRRFKNDIQDMGAVSEKLMQLRPVTFRYKDVAERGPHHLQYGLIAEEVAKVYPDLVQYDKAGKPFTVYYHLLAPMLLNELQKEHRQNAAQKIEITAMKAAHNAELTTLISELASLRAVQEHQRQMLAKLTAYAQIAPNKELLHDAVLARH